MIPCERLAMVLRLVQESIRKTVANSSHSSEIRALQSVGHTKK